MTQVNDSKGVQAGDNNVQLNLFVGQAPRGAVVAGSVPQAPPAFQPRDDLMAQLRAHGPGVSVVRAVTGLRGVGKTQLAAAYARECIDAGWRLVAWVNAEDTPALLAGLEVVASRLGIDRPGTAIEVIAAEVRNRVEADGERCLLIYDNVTDAGALRPYLPAAGKAQVIVTSTQASALTLGRPTGVAVFTAPEARDFLTERTGRNDPAGAELVAAELGRLPLAVAQAAAVIKSRHLSYNVYLSRLRAYPAERYLPPAVGDPYPRGVAESILLSLDTVTAADPTGLCADLLAAISLLSPDGVPRDLLYQGGGKDSFGVGAETIDESLAGLAAASLLTIGGEDETNPTVTAHRLVMRVVRERCVSEGTLAAIGAKTTAMVTAASGSLGVPWRRRAIARDLVQQVMALSECLNQHLSPQDGPLMESLLERRGWTLWCLNELGDSASRAVALAEALVIDDERVLGATHTETLVARHHLAFAYRAAGRLDDAIPMYERTLADCIRVLGDDHPETLKARNNLAVAYGAAGRSDGALPLLERTLADRVRVLGDDHPDTLNSRNNLAGVYDSTGRLGEAVAMYERTLADCVRVLGEEHPGTLKTRMNLAYAYEELGRWDEAISLYEQAAKGFERVLGRDHPDTVVARGTLTRARKLTARKLTSDDR